MNTTKRINRGGQTRKWQCYQYCYIREDYETPVEEKLSFRQIESEFLQNHKKWFTIKDDEYDLSKLQSKKRYEITKAHKFCRTEEINPFEKIEKLFEVYKESFTAYPERYRPKEILFEPFKEYISSLVKTGLHEFYATYYKTEEKMCGFLIIAHKENFITLKQQKTIHEYEKYNCNAALIDFVLSKYNEKLKKKEVIFTNGSRSIKHETNFNAYLEKYFGFRKAYANLRIVYKFPFEIIVKILRPFRKLFEHTRNSFLYNLYCVLKMDSYTSK